jgi:hypothetical protein
MFGCCSAMTVKYIDEDKTLSVEKLKQFFGETTTVFQGPKGLMIKIQQKVDPNNLTDNEMEMVFARQDLPEKTERTYPLCLCPCHMVGTMVEC